MGRRYYLRGALSALPLNVVRHLTIGLPAARKVLSLATALSSLLIISACAGIEGYPTDPENTSSVLSALSTYFDPSIDYQYNQLSDQIARRELRDTIVLNRMRAYDIEFDKFERDLYGQANGIETVGDLTVIAAGAVGAVSGAAITKSAINAGTSAVTGAQGKISKDLFYERTLPAIISQMEANRTKIKTGILLGLKQSDSIYPLAAAYMDLESLKNSGGIPPAISNVTQIASANAQDAVDALQVVSTESFRTSASASGTTLQDWLIKGGGGIAANSAQLRGWMDGHGLKGTQFQQFLNQPGYEAQREQAIKSLVK